MQRMVRAEVIDGAWRRLGPGVESLSTQDGGPLSRTVKLVVVPLVLRPSARRELAAAVIGPAQAALIEQLIGQDRERLIHTAGWLDALLARPESEQVGRDRCYPTAYALATTHGEPRPSTAEPVAQEALMDLLAERGAVSTAAVRAVAADPRQAARLSATLDRRWSDHPTPDPVEESAVQAWASAVLEGWVPGGARPRPEATKRAEQAWSALIDGGVGTHTGAALRADTWPQEAAPVARPRRLGLTEQIRVACPTLDTPERTTAPRPWDRSIVERVLVMLQHTSDRSGLPAAHDLLADEVDRASGAWQLGVEPTRVVMVLGTVLALGLDGAAPADTQAHRIVAGMRRRESWLARAQRQPDTPAGHTVTDDVTDPVAPYLRRLWTRLHGSEHRGTVPADPQEGRTLLIGVARSVLMDGRSRVRAALLRRQEGRG
ncbi:hypothetical protein [Cellulomonas sp. NPDC089187]|uniref:hypothetical protein n=1 Tax=Cellulomonas sp. NPDC089187 TaxID=3154970 RepID=UPI00344A93DE